MIILILQTLYIYHNYLKNKEMLANLFFIRKERNFILPLFVILSVFFVNYSFGNAGFTSFDGSELESHTAMYETLFSKSKFGKAAHIAIACFGAYKRYLEIKEVIVAYALGIGST